MSDRGSKRQHSDERRPDRRQTQYVNQPSTSNTPPAPKRLIQPEPQLRSEVTVVSRLQPSSSTSASASASTSANTSTMLQNLSSTRIPRISERASSISHSALQNQLAASTTGPRPLRNDREFVPPQTATSQKQEYTALSMRGSLVQSQKGGAPAPLPNEFGYLLDGTQEPTIPSSAPVARWNVANYEGQLYAGFTFRQGINPTQFEVYREHGQLHLYCKLQPVPSFPIR